ncbi:cell envelope integrity protein TolA [Cronobacter dublinensis]
MWSLHKMFGLLLVVGFVSACTCNAKNGNEVGHNDPNKTPSPDETRALFEKYQSHDRRITQSTESMYAAQIHQAVSEHIENKQSYSGKACTLRITLQRNGLINSAMAEKGDAEFCRALVSAVKRAKIPAAPDEETWRAFRKTQLDFIL